MTDDISIYTNAHEPYPVDKAQADWFKTLTPEQMALARALYKAHYQKHVRLDEKYHRAFERLQREHSDSIDALFNELQAALGELQASNSCDHPSSHPPESLS